VIHLHSDCERHIRALLIAELDGRCESVMGVKLWRLEELRRAIYWREADDGFVYFATLVK
jgi:hypothetical protein